MGRRTGLAIRSLILTAFLIGLLGVGAELLLVGHVEGALQWAPVILIALCLAGLCWHGAAESRASLSTLRVIMTLFVLAGITGIIVHCQGKLAFKRELDPSLGGMKLFAEAMKSQSPPALAPGAFIQLAILGFAYTSIRSTK